MQGGAKAGLQLRVHETKFILVLLFVNYCIGLAEKFVCFPYDGSSSA